MKQPTIHISFDREGMSLYNEIMRRSALSYIPSSKLCRVLMKEGLKTLKEKELISAY
tara:strand:- start:190 stop:360 length:171 start_codon:yes stop_codon:yes gene_type:complete